MKTTLLTLALACSMAGFAQTAYQPGGNGSNWSIGVDAGVGTPMEHHKFFGDMRAIIGLHIQKQISPAFALGIEGTTGINTSSWNVGQALIDNPGYPMFDHQYRHLNRSNTMFDNLYVGAYGSVNLMRLFTPMQSRLFEMEVTAGAGWGHEFYSHMSMFPYSIDTPDQNYFVTKVGVNFNFNVNENLTLSVKPYLAWNMTGTHLIPLEVEQTTAAYKSVRGTFNVLAGLSYNFGPGFEAAPSSNAGEIAALNDKINDMRGKLAADKNALAAEEARTAQLQQALAAARRQPQQQTQTVNNAETILYVYYELSSPVIRQSQVPVVEMVANYLKHNPDSKVIVKGYASQDGEAAFNEKLSGERAESVKNMLTSKFGIPADRIKTDAGGILTQFKELSWNRVAICIIEKN